MKENKEKKYVRVRITLPKSANNAKELVFVEQWKDASDARDVEFLAALDDVLSNSPSTNFIKIRNSSGNIQIIPREFLKKALISIEYGNYTWI